MDIGQLVVGRIFAPNSLGFQTLFSNHVFPFFVRLGCRGMSKFLANAHRLLMLCYTGRCMMQIIMNMSAVTHAVGLCRLNEKWVRFSGSRVVSGRFFGVYCMCVHTG